MGADAGAAAPLTGRRRAAAVVGGRSRRTWAVLGLVAVAVATGVGFLLYPTYPNYDSYYSLVWARELLHGTAPTFDAYRAPTEHPLAIGFSLLLALLGDAGDRLLVAAAMVSFVALVAGLYRLAAVSFGALAGVAAAVLLCTRFDFPFLALRAYVDVPYLALVVWAAALEAARPRRGAAVLVVLAAAGLLRPEAWLLSGLYFLWIAPRATGRQRVLLAALVALPPLVWCAVDLAVTGQVLFSLGHTNGLAEELGRQSTLAGIPGATLRFLEGLAKWPILAAAAVGLPAGLVLAPRRGLVVLALLLAGLGTWLLVGVAGLSMVYRYLLIPALAVLVYAGVALTGWTLLPPGHRWRGRWAVAACALLAGGALFTATHLTLGNFVRELEFRGRSHAALRDLLRSPPVRAARRCGPVSLPNHKLLPEARWILGAGEDQVIARSDPTQRRRIRRGVAVYAVDPTAFRRYGYRPDSIRNALPLPGFRPASSNRYYRALVRC
jgi:hypothetical protein